MKYSPIYKPFGEAAMLMEWPAEINEAISRDVISFQQKIQHKHIKETIQSIHSITVIYDSQLTFFDELKTYLEALYQTSSNEALANQNDLWKIPVCYDRQFGLDLQEVSDSNGLSIDEIIDLHSHSIYQVYSIGFLPGFLYLGGLDQRLHIARKSHPRLQLLKGAVGIGGQQTGIYPTASPGGWQIIGNTPIPLFDVSKELPCFAKPGDKIQFDPISLSRHETITELIKLGTYKLSKEEMIYD